MWYLDDTIDVSDHIKGVQAGRESAMKTENLILYHCCEGKVVEQVSEVLPHICIAVLAQALVVEAVDLGDLSALVVASQNRDSFLKAHLEADEKSHSLNTVVATIDVVAHEQVVCVWRATTNFEELHQVMELSVHIAANRHRTFHRLHVQLC